MEAFWAWFKSGGPGQHLRDVGREDVKLDEESLLLLGESAGETNLDPFLTTRMTVLRLLTGGYLSIQSVLSGYIRPKAMISLYPMLDMKADHYTREYPKPIVNVPNYPMSVVDVGLASMGEPITEADPPARLDLALASVQTGRYLDFLGASPELFVMDRLREGRYAKSPGTPIFPPLFVLHGEQDSAVPVEGTRRFVELIKQKDRQAKYLVAYQPGDHGFDFQATLKDEWLRDGLDWISLEWLKPESKCQL